VATNFPSSADSFTNPTTSDTLASVPHASQHADVNDAVEAIETALLDGAPLHIDDANQRVGIGTTSPSQTLDVRGIARVGDDADRTPDANGVGHLMIDGNAYGGFISLDATGMWVGHNSGGRDLYLATDETARVTVGASGNVGVGTTTPTTKIDVYTDAAAGVPYPLTLSAKNSAGAKKDYVRVGFGIEQGAAGIEAGGFRVQTLRNGSITDALSFTGSTGVQTWDFYTEGSSRMTIASSGKVSVTGGLAYPLHPFSAYYSAQPASWSGPTTIVFNNTLFNGSNAYSSSTGRYTAPVSGYYHFRAHFFKYTTYTNSSNTYWGISTSNGYFAKTNHGAASYDGGQEVSMVCYLEAGDYAYVEISTASTMTSYHSSHFNSFSGYLISQT
jgi:hypothetical protein